MLLNRVIPCLLVSDGALYKTVKFENKKYVGDPINTVRVFNDLEVDELVVLDISASKNGAAPNLQMVAELASECFMPLCYGGGIQTVEQAERVFAAGVEKVSINTAAQQDVALIGELSQRFGSQSIVVSVDVKKTWTGNTKLFSHTAEKIINGDVLEYICRMEEAGAGELLLTAVHREGTMTGYDLNLIETVAKATSIPVIAHGGAGTLKDLQSALEAGASAVACGSRFVYEGPHRAVLVNYLNMEEYQRINPRSYS